MPEYLVRRDRSWLGSRGVSVHHRGAPAEVVTWGVS